MELLASLLLGIGLSAACGMRLFIPPLVLSVAGLYFHLPLPEGITWLATFPAFYGLLTATLLEVGAYYVPWLDHLLDTLTTPVAVVAGTLITSSFAGDLPPALKWGIALIAGGGAAGSVQMLTNTSRLASLATTAGLANPVVATIENGLALVFSVITVVFPLLGVLLIAALLVAVAWLTLKLTRKAKSLPEQPGSETSS